MVSNWSCRNIGTVEEGMGNDIDGAGATTRPHYERDQTAESQTANPSW